MKTVHKKDKVIITLELAEAESINFDLQKGIKNNYFDNLTTKYLAQLIENGLLNLKEDAKGRKNA